jgi:hypothetical protein
LGRQGAIGDVTDMREQEEDAGDQPSLLEQLCGADEPLYAVLSSYLYYRPQDAVSKKDVSVLIEEAERGGDFRLAIDKAIFEGTQNPEERDRYIELVQDLASRAARAAEDAKAAQEQAGLADRAASLGKKIENYRFMAERAGDILAVATDYYSERLLESGESVRRVARQDESRRLANEEREIEKQEKADRAARRRERKKMSRSERRAARKQEKIERLAAEDRRKKRAAKRADAETEGRRVEEAEATAREERRRERREN